MSDQGQPGETHGANPPAGWYPDPQGVTRWWDGTAWGAEAAPAVQPAQPPVPAVPGSPAVPVVPGSPAVPVVPGSPAMQGSTFGGPGDETGTAALAHALGAVGFLFPCFGWVGPLIVYLTAKPHQGFVRHHAAEELNFQLTLVIAYVVSFVLMFVCVGFVTAAIVWILNLVFPIVAAIKANNGEWYRYPMNIRMVSGAVG